MISGSQLHMFRHFGSGGDSGKCGLYDDAAISGRHSRTLDRLNYEPARHLSF